MLKTKIPESMKKIEEQINALEYALKHDERQKDIEIHQQAINALKTALNALQEVNDTPSNAGRKKNINAELVKKLRGEGMTQEEVARKLNISLSSVRRNERLK